MPEFDLDAALEALPDVESTFVGHPGGKVFWVKPEDRWIPVASLYRLEDRTWFLEHFYLNFPRGSHVTAEMENEMVQLQHLQPPKQSFEGWWDSLLSFWLANLRYFMVDPAEVAPAFHPMPPR